MEPLRVTSRASPPVAEPPRLPGKTKPPPAVQMKGEPSSLSESERRLTPTMTPVLEMARAWLEEKPPGLGNAPMPTRPSAGVQWKAWKRSLELLTPTTVEPSGETP